jgi:hypothetical protein
MVVSLESNERNICWSCNDGSNGTRDKRPAHFLPESHVAILFFFDRILGVFIDTEPTTTIDELTQYCCIKSFVESYINQRLPSTPSLSTTSLAMVKGDRLTLALPASSFLAWINTYLRCELP